MHYHCLAQHNILYTVCFLNLNTTYFVEIVAHSIGPLLFVLCAWVHVCARCVCRTPEILWKKIKGVLYIQSCMHVSVCYMCMGTHWDQRHWTPWSWDSNSGPPPPHPLEKQYRLLHAEGSISLASENVITHILMVFTPYSYPLAPPRSSPPHFDVFFFFFK